METQPRDQVPKVGTYQLSETEPLTLQRTAGCAAPALESPACPRPLQMPALPGRPDRFGSVPRPAGPNSTAPALVPQEAKPEQPLRGASLAPHNAPVPARPQKQPIGTKTQQPERAAARAGQTKKTTFRKARASFRGVRRRTPAPPPERTRDTVVFTTRPENPSPARGRKAPGWPGEGQRFPEGSGR